MIILNIKINGIIYSADNSLNYDHIHQLVQENTYDSIGDAIFSKISDSIHQSEWYQYTPQKFDLVENFNQVQAICNQNLDCYADSLNWSIMNKTELTSDFYKFITQRIHVVKQGFTDNFLPDYIDLHAIMDLIDWHFILDCVSWFI
ncbi:hypothetical protein NDK43_03975 [Neobacillus pocheonensis]|uniref:Uncharacterized protein n=1 Tax=Neobacillus pocheonensis TaxID=363869 RepID=A0ABT0W866_9BACI|nr:hypothetical protein [Neobacillus pocheonensis]